MTDTVTVTETVTVIVTVTVTVTVTVAVTCSKSMPEMRDGVPVKARDTISCARGRKRECV